VPLDIEVGIISSLGRRYFELLQKLDQLMPLLQTLEIEEVLTARDADHQRAEAKKLVINIASTTRQLATGIRRRLNEADARREVPVPRPPQKWATPPVEPEADTTVADVPVEAVAAVESGGGDVVVVPPAATGADVAEPGDVRVAA
jgi:septum formation inhibitor MinC